MDEKGFVVAAGESAGLQVATPVMQLWWGPHEGSMPGVYTDHIVTLDRRRLRSDQLHHLALLGHLGTMSKCLGDDRLAAFVGMDPRDHALVGDEVEVDDFTSTVVLVEELPSWASFITYRGLDFVLGDDVEHQPYAMVRPSGPLAPWPALRLTGLPEEAWW